MNLIVCVDNNNGIGFKNSLLYNFKEDMKFFKLKTLNKIVVMGKNTLLSLPNSKPLKNRVNIVLSTTLERDDCIICSDISSLFECLRCYNSDDIYVIGGESLYLSLIDYCERAFVTKVDGTKKSDAFFPDIENLSNWIIVNKNEVTVDNSRILICEYENKSVKVF